MEEKTRSQGLDSQVTSTHVPIIKLKNKIKIKKIKKNLTYNA